MGRRPWMWLLLLLLQAGATEAGGVLLPFCGGYRERSAAEDGRGGGREGVPKLSLCE